MRGRYSCDPDFGDTVMAISYPGLGAEFVSVGTLDDYYSSCTLQLVTDRSQIANLPPAPAGDQCMSYRFLIDYDDNSSDECTTYTSRAIGSPVLDESGLVVGVVNGDLVGEATFIDFAERDIEMLEEEQPFDERRAELPPTFGW